MIYGTEEIVAAVKRSRGRTVRVTMTDVIMEFGGMVNVEYRAIDRALQRARKAGAIKWDSKRGWTVVEKKP